MVNPINLPSFILPGDLNNTELPANITRAAAPVTPSGQTHPSGTATRENTHDDAFHFTNTPLEKTLEQLNNAMQAWAIGMRFDIDEDAQRVVVSIVDSETGEVLRTVPSESVIRIAKMIVQLQGGAIDTHA